MFHVAKRPPKRIRKWLAATLLSYLLALVVLAQPARAWEPPPQRYRQADSDDYDYGREGLRCLDILNTNPAPAPPGTPPASSPAAWGRTTAQPSGNWRNPATAPWIRALMAFLRH